MFLEKNRIKKKEKKTLFFIKKKKLISEKINRSRESFKLLIISRIVYNCIFFKKEIIFFHINRGWGGGVLFFTFVDTKNVQLKNDIVSYQKDPQKINFVFFTKI